jgi:hypothetical protein
VSPLPPPFERSLPDDPPPAPTAQLDHFARWPLYSGVAVLVVVSTAYLLPTFLAIPILLVLCLPAIIAELLGTIVAVLWCAPAALFRRHWRRAVSMLALPVMILLTVPSAEVTRSIREEVRFSLNKGRYEVEVARAKAEGKHIAWVDDWSIFFNANDFVVWDEWDDPEIASGFKLKQRFGRHFYLVGD